MSIDDVIGSVRSEIGQLSHDSVSRMTRVKFVISHWSVSEVEAVYYGIVQIENCLISYGGGLSTSL